MARGKLSDGSRDWLLAEMARWQSEGILSAEQAERILQSYETPAEAAQRKHSIAVFTLTAIAAFLVLLGIFLLIGYRWQAMVREAKLATIFAVILSAYGLGFYLRYRRKARLASELVFFVACILYGCGAWLIADLLHVRTHYPDGLWIWALGVLPLALCLDTFLLHALLVGLLAAWVWTEIGNFGFPPGPRLLGPWLAPPGACLSLPLLALPGLLWAYRRRSAPVLSLYVTLVAAWMIFVPMSWQRQVNPAYLAGASAAVLLACAQCHPIGSPMAIPYRACGALTMACVLALMSFAEVCRDMLQQVGTPRGNLAAGIAIVLVGMLLIAAADRMRGKGPGRPDAEPGFLRRQGLALGLLAFMAGLCLWNGLFGSAGPGHGPPGSVFAKGSAIVLLPALAANAGMILLAIWLMRIGLREDRAVPFAAGVILFLLWAVLRYVELFAGTAGMLGASLFFIFCGACLFGVARFWMRRKELHDV